MQRQGRFRKGKDNRGNGMMSMTSKLVNIITAVLLVLLTECSAAAIVSGEAAAPKLTRRSVKISAVGDCTIGWDDRFTWGNRFDAYLEKNNGRVPEWPPSSCY